jgi:hypothetical protein
MVDPDYLTNGLLEKAIDLVDQYISKLDIKGLSRKIYSSKSGMKLICYVIQPSS